MTFLLVGTVPLLAEAATLGVSPSTVSVQEGNIVTVRLSVNTQGTAINQGEGTLRFPTDMLEIVSVSKSNSIFSLWVEEPRFSNAAGTVQFDGGVPTPGYNGTAGTIVSITFLAKKSGIATLSLSDTAIRANDGLGTDVLRSSANGQITITAAAAPPAAPPPSTPEPAPTPTGNGSITSLISPTHSDQETWYQNSSALLQWKLPAGATAVQTTIDTDASATPKITYQPAIVERRISDLTDGIWYFNVRARTGGSWGPIASYTLRVDTTVPDLRDASLEYDAANRALLISDISAEDAASGIDHFELSVDGAEATIVTAEEFLDGTYAVPYDKSGTHTLVIRAIDRAGNTSETSGTFSVPTALVNQTLWNIGGVSISFAWLIIFLIALSLLSLTAAGAALYKLFILREGSKSRIDKRDKLLHRSLRIFKEDLEQHLRTLERAGSRRALTEAEEDINEQLKQNVDDLERYLKKEFKKFD